MFGGPFGHVGAGNAHQAAGRRQQVAQLLTVTADSDDQAAHDLTGAQWLSGDGEVESGHIVLPGRAPHSPDHGLILLR
jgi:hypothetical protein